MITPTKGITPDRALLALGAQILQQLDQPVTVSQAWSRLRIWRTEHGHRSPISFGWFVLALDVLYAVGVLELRQDVLVVRRANAAPNHR